MKLLIITQKVDAHDPILGFFLRWIEGFARHCERVSVIGQLAREHPFPPNVHIVSLRKEDGLPVWRQILRFWRLQWSMRREYDRVFVHMTPVWVVLGAPLWFCLRKPVYLWYEARGGGWALPVALRCVRTVFSATAYGLPRRSRRHEILGHGIDTDFFVPDDAKRDEHLITAIGRVTRVKHLDVILDAFAQLDASYRLVLAGGPVTQQDHELLQVLEQRMRTSGIHDRVAVGPVSHARVRDVLQQSALLLHAGSGGLDKVILEAMACGCLVAVSSRAAQGILPSECLCTNETMGSTAKHLLSLSPEKRTQLATELRRRVTEGHSLVTLIERMVAAMQR